MIATCNFCGNQFEYFKSQSSGKYCGLKCSAAGRKTEEHSRMLKEFKNGKLKKRDSIRKLLTEQRGYNCEICGIWEHNGKSITLQVDHIDGNPDNNLPKNVRLLCPNCHSQTDTYKGGNKGKLKNDQRNVNLRKRYATLRDLKALEELRAFSSVVRAVHS